jgi:glycine cleavage system regulatory protein
MSKEILLQQPTQTEREPATEIEIEIDCPRCYDIMTLSNDFDRLYYFCEECNLSLLIK